MPLRSFAPRSFSSNRLPRSLARALRQDEHAGLCDPLQACREVRRLADDAAFLRLSRSDQVADHDQPGCDPDPHLQGQSSRGDELGHRFDEREAGLHRALGVVFMSLGIAEIDQYAVAHILGDKPAVAFDDRRAAAMIGADDLPQVLGIELGRKGGRTDQVAEHQCELTAFSGVPGRRRDRSPRRLRCNRVQFADRAQQLLAIAEDDAEFLQVLIREVAKDREIDAVFGKTPGIFRHAELLEPRRNLLHYAPRRK